MKLQLLHGPAISSSRVKLINIKKGFDQQDVVVYEEGSDIQTILGSLMTPSLFSNEQLIILENPPEDFNYQLPASRGEPTTNYQLIVWFDHEISEKKPIMEWVKKEKGEVLFFPEAKEVSVFPLLDYLAHGDKKAFLELDKLKKAPLRQGSAGQAGFDIQYFITMIFYLLRSLTVTPKNAPAFVKQKLERQRKNFDLEKIKNLYKEVLEIDFKIKSGLLEKDHAEFLLVSKYVNL